MIFQEGKSIREQLIDLGLLRLSWSSSFALARPEASTSVCSGFEIMQIQKVCAF